MPSNVGAVAVRTEAAVSPVMFGGGGASRPASHRGLSHAPLSPPSPSPTPVVVARGEADA